MAYWINFKKQQPTADNLYCWVMNTKKGAYGFIATWCCQRMIFELDGGSSDKNPALDVTHWYPLPLPKYDME